jgi:protein-disulfide isomerase
VLNRRIEVSVRTEFSLPQTYNVSIGARRQSAFSGYDDLSVTISSGGHSQVIESDIDVTNRPIRGNPAAKVTIINFDDLECPYCARMHEALFPSTLDRYKDKVRFIYKDFPLEEIHPWALHASVDANCLAAQNSEIYWGYVDYLHSHGDEVSGPDRDLKKSFAALDRIARQEATIAKLDTTTLDACMAKQDETEINNSLKEASVLGLDGAPALFVNGERINGAVPEEQVWIAIDRALRAAGEEPPPPPAQPAAAKSGGGN